MDFETAGTIVWLLSVVLWYHTIAEMFGYERLDDDTDDEHKR